jgi:hypothetical protein
VPNLKKIDRGILKLLPFKVSAIKVNKMHIIDVGMQYYTHIARFTTVTLRTLTEINEN